MALYELKNVSFSYPVQGAPALKGVSLGVEEGEFHLLCGPSGCGKSTLLRHLKPALTPNGQGSGVLLYKGEPLSRLSQEKQTAEIGFVLQSPENQIVADKVWHELAFGLESLGLDTPAIRRRVAEMAAFFGIEDWFHRDVASLSGGQKQLLNLASVMVLQPRVLILDEPTSQLDPIAASDFLATLGKINRELGTTVILSEHRLEEAFALATSVSVLDSGELLYSGSPEAVSEQLRRTSHGMFLTMPAPVRVWAATQSLLPCPITVREGREFLTEFAREKALLPLPEEEKHPRGDKILELKEIYFQYEKDGPEVLKGLSLTARRGELLAVMGGNGAGKSTLLKLLSALKKPTRGRLMVKGKTALLPQNPQTLFAKNTLAEDLEEIMPQDREDYEAVVSLCRLEGLLDRHPFDLSGGEQQRAALAKVLLTKPEILLLDEPTKGMDGEFKACFATMLQQLTEHGVTMILVSHDVDFCARYAHRCALLFDGGMVAEGAPRSFFSGNSFYTTAANRMARHLVPEAVTAEDIIAVCGGIQPPAPKVPHKHPPRPPAQKPGKKKKLPLWRRLLGAAAGVLAVGLFIKIVWFTKLAVVLSQPNFENLAPFAVFVGALLLLGFSLGQKGPFVVPKSRLKAPKRTVLVAVLVLLLVPLTLFLGMKYFGNRRYYLTALLVLVECMVPFFLLFEGRKPRARELVTVAVLCAVGVAGRAVLFFLPQFKPVLALTIIAGAALGGETGFLVGAMSMLLSNMLFSQGPWTPWQMFAAGSIGFLAGLLFHRGRILPRRGILSIFGALAAIVIYGGIMNATSLLMWSDKVTLSLLLPYYISGFPMDCVHAFATAFFLWVAGEPLLEKLERLQIKFGTDDSAK